MFSASAYPFFVTKIGSSSSWHRVEMAVVFFKSLMGTILGICVLLVGLFYHGNHICMGLTKCRGEGYYIPTEYLSVVYYL